MNARYVYRLAIVLTAGWLVGLLSAAGPVAASAPPRWGEPVPVSPELYVSWFPDIHTDRYGRTHLAWATPGLAEGRDGAVMFTTLDEPDCRKPGDIAVVNSNHVARPLIATDDKYIHILFRSDLSGPVRQFHMRALLTANLCDAHSWSAPQLISEGESYYAQIVALPDGTLVAAYNSIVSISPVDGKPRTQVFSRRSTDGGETWEKPVRVSDTQERVARVSMVATSDGKAVVIAWDEGYDNITGFGEPLGIGTAQSGDGGASWDARQAIRSPLGPIEQAAVAVGSDGLLLVYRATREDRLLYRLGSDGGRVWSDEHPVPEALARPYFGKQHFDKLGLATDGDGRILLAYVGTDASVPSGLAVMVTTYAGGEWTQPARVAAPDGFPEYPRPAVALGNQLRLTYFVRDQQWGLGHYILYVITGQSDAHALAAASYPIAPVLAPTAVPRPAPAVLLQPHPTPPPAPVPLRVGDDPLRTPQAEVKRPALGAILATLAALGLFVPAMLLSRWLAADP